ncbi:hypothetical protein AMD00_04150 [Viridibacillus arvi]|uniref:Uncharacterized protein n=1 Tax=Viridibacillus arvi TaxID=263475 RepID=A0A0M0LKT9_9BACL|nr:hypothetical protein AMD00_04150 [Viridibacillus arvi]
MEFANFALGFMQILALVSVLYLIFSFFFRDKKEIISVIFNFILLIMINYFVITQKDFMFDNFTNYLYGFIVLLLLMYFVFFRSLYSYIKTKAT